MPRGVSMIIYTTNILAVPFIVLLWALDLYLFLVAVRLIVADCPRNGRAGRCRCCRPSLTWFPRRWIGA